MMQKKLDMELEKVKELINQNNIKDSNKRS